MATTPGGVVGIAPYIARAGERIERYFRDVDRDGDALVIGVFGEWGSGKSTLLGEIRRTVDAQAADTLRAGEDQVVTLTVDFNPWRYEREDHLLVPLLKVAEKRLSDFVDGRARIARERVREGWSPQRRRLHEAARTSRVSAWWERCVDRFDAPKLGRDTAAWVGDRLVLLGACTIALTKMVKLKAGVPMLGEVELSPYDALKAAQEQIDRSQKRPPAVDAPQGHVSLYYDLYAQLRAMTRGPESVEDDAPPAPKLNFLFLVDDLDRCLPDKAVEMLEAIKLFLDVAGCVFVLALDDEVVERGIAHRYRDYLQLGDRGAESIAYSLKPERYDAFTARASTRLPPITGSEYLEKIIQVPFRLPRWSRTEARVFLLQRFPVLFPTLPDPAAREPRLTPGAEWLLELFLDAVPIVPRKMVRAGELLEFLRGVAVARDLALDDYTLAQITLLQLFAPQCFRYLRRERRGAWVTFHRRIYEAQRRKPAIDHLSNHFFEWWTRKCRADGDEGQGRYAETIELPFIDEVRQAANNRSGFDPRRLVLVHRSMRCVADLGPYFSLFAEPAAAADPEVRSVAAPIRRESFVDYLAGPSAESWQQALEEEPGLRGGILDDVTFNQLAARLAGRDPALTADWLETVAPILTGPQIDTLFRQSDLVARLWTRHRQPPPTEPA